MSVKILYLAAYLSLKRDLHKNIKINSNDYQYIEEYCNSIKKVNIKSIILTDDSSNGFEHVHNIANGINIMNYSNKINFDKSSIFNKFLLHDNRFLYFYKYMYDHHNIDYFMLTDVSDVKILNPIERIIDINKKTLYVGRENENILENKWFDEFIISNEFVRASDCYLCDYKEVFNNRLILNCGTIFGHRNIMLKLLEKVIFYMCGIYSKYEIKRPFDMFIVNYVVYKFFNNELYMGNELTTSFGQDQYDMSKVVKHK